MSWQQQRTHELRPYQSYTTLNSDVSQATTFNQARNHNDILDKALWTRNICIAGLCAGWMTGFVAIGGGCYCLYVNLKARNNNSQGAEFQTSQYTKEVLPLGINIILTLLNEAMGYIHNISLRWTLQYENKLEFNSNLRLLSSSARSRPNKWYSNIAFLFFIVLSYATTSSIFLGWNPALQKTLTGVNSDYGSDNLIKVSGIALIVFGISLLGQAIISTWALATTKIPTWSSNPLDTLYACTDEHSPNRIARRKDRCMKSVHQRLDDATPVFPQRKQGPAISAHHEVKYVLVLLWLLVPLGGLWGGVIYTMIVRDNKNGVLGNSWAFIPEFTGTYYNQSCPVHRCTVGTSVLNVGWTASNGNSVLRNLGTIGSIFLIAAFQAGLTLALHCAELIVNLSRDEGIFRMAITPKGTDPRYKSIVAAFTSWQTVTLFAFKAAVHWLFGLSINNDYVLGVNMYPAQIFYFTAFALAVALFAMYVSLRKPVGYLPATFGHLATLADLIDEWDPRMFWGHKEEGNNGNPSYAGTSATWLPEPDEGRRYGGDPTRRGNPNWQNSTHSQFFVADCDTSYNGGVYNI